MDCLSKTRRFKGHHHPTGHHYYYRRNPSIKITVSADLPECIRHEVPDLPPPHEILKMIMIEECNREGGSKSREGTVTKVIVDDSIVDFPNCIDFGIKDFLCCQEEIDLELSSDTDTSFLEATPPHRFSDSELESQIEIMSITLDTVLNSVPKTGNWNRSLSRDDIFTVDLRVHDVTEKSQNFRSISDATDVETDEEKTVEEEEVNNGESINKAPNEPIRRPPPPRPFRRQISLPASIFMSYFLAAESNLTKNGIQIKSISKQRINENNEECLNNIKNDRFSNRRLTKIDGSYSSSTESTEEQDSNDFHQNEDNCSMGGISCGDESSEATNTPIYLNSSELKLGRKETMSVEKGHDRDSPVFTSEIEKRSLILRYMRRLIRQDTSTNFAPQDYCI